jgi:SAM-dependent methyltransferase
MKRWVLKAAVQKAISLMPYKHRLNYFFQKHVTKGAYLTDELFEDKLIHCAAHAAAFEKYATIEKDGALEIGTGWYPIVPIGLYLLGFSNIVSIDISSLISRKSVLAAINRFSDYQSSGKLSDFLPVADAARLEAARELATGGLSAVELMSEMGIRLVVGDASATDFPDDSFCLIHSNNTLEHIYPDVLRKIFHEFHRILRPNGLMSHNIDMSDHFAHLDRSITNFNFLKFSDREWKMIDNSIQPQNRLRITDFEKMFKDSGFQILKREDRVGTKEQLNSIRLAKKYSSYSVEDLLVTHSQLVSKKTGEE